MIIYKITNLINGKIYVGSDKNNNPEYYGSGKLLKQAIEKYGKENFKKETICECSELTDLIEKENYWIKHLGANLRGIGYNISDGYFGGDTFTNNPNKEKIRRNKSKAAKQLFENPEYKEKVTKNFKNSFKGKKHTESTKLKISKTKKIQMLNPNERKKCGLKNIGREPWHKGTKGIFRHSEITKQKMSKTRIGKKLLDSTKVKISEARKGIKISEHTKEKLRIINTKDKNPRYIHFSALETNFIIALIKKNVPLSQIVTEFFDFFNKKISITPIKRIKYEFENNQTTKTKQ